MMSEKNKSRNSSYTKGTRLFLTCCLIGGGLVLLSTVTCLLQDLTDRSFIRYGIPGFITAICLFLIYGLGMRLISKNSGEK